LIGTISPLFYFSAPAIGKKIEPLETNTSPSYLTRFTNWMQSILFTTEINEKNPHSLKLGDTTSIWTTNLLGIPKTEFLPGETVYIHGKGW
jgi:hypothetical protein